MTEETLPVYLIQIVWNKDGVDHTVQLKFKEAWKLSVSLREQGIKFQATTLNCDWFANS
jgi:hypothetical protein